MSVHYLYTSGKIKKTDLEFHKKVEVDSAGVNHKRAWNSPTFPV